MGLAWLLTNVNLFSQNITENAIQKTTQKLQLHMHTLNQEFKIFFYSYQGRPCQLSIIFQSPLMLMIDVRSFFNLKGKHTFFLQEIPSYSLDEQSRFYTISYKHYEVKIILAPKICYNVTYYK